jgi:hypothetical protein
MNIETNPLNERSMNTATIESICAVKRLSATTIFVFASIRALQFEQSGKKQVLDPGQMIE